MTKFAKKGDLYVALEGITYESVAAALKGVSEVKDNGINVYTNITIEPVLGASYGENPPSLYEGEVILYSIDTPGEPTAYAGIIHHVLLTDVSEGTTRGAELRKRGKNKQWLLVVKRFGIPKLYDIIDQYTVGSRLLFIMESIHEASHEMKGSKITFEEIVGLLSSGCVKADVVLEGVAGKVLGYSKDINDALDELKDPDNPPSLH